MAPVFIFRAHLFLQTSAGCCETRSLSEGCCMIDTLNLSRPPPGMSGVFWLKKHTVGYFSCGTRCVYYLLVFLVSFGNQASQPIKYLASPWSPLNSPCVRPPQVMKNPRRIDSIVVVVISIDAPPPHASGDDPARVRLGRVRGRRGSAQHARRGRPQGDPKRPPVAGARKQATRPKMRVQLDSFARKNGSGEALAHALLVLHRDGRKFLILVRRSGLGGVRERFGSDPVPLPHPSIERKKSDTEAILNPLWLRSSLWPAADVFLYSWLFLHVFAPRLAFCMSST